jgi:iron complex transport system substrate-binding protein
MKHRLIKSYIQKMKFLVLFAGLLLGASAHALTVKDARNQTVYFERSPQRVISMLPSLTETVCALGQCARLIGVDRYSNYPKTVKKLPQLGGGLDPNLEAIVALRPDVVLMAQSSKGHARLTELGIKVLLLEPKNQADVLQSLHTLGDLFEMPAKYGSLKVWGEMQKGITLAAKDLRAEMRGSSVYFEAGAPYAAGEASFVGELFKQVGVKNIVPASMGPFPALNPEFVVSANPDVMMLSETGQKELLTRPGWANMKAIRHGKVCAFSEDERDVLVRPGPRMVQAVQLIVTCLNKQSFKL